MSQRETLTGIVLDEHTELTLQEVCEICGVTETMVIEMVSEGVAEPLNAESDKPVFSGAAATRLMTAWRLQRDLHVNLPGAALAIELLEEITELKRKRGF